MADDRGTRVAVVTYAGLPDLAEDDHPLVDALKAVGALPEAVVWDDPRVVWETFDFVLVRSPWDYPAKPSEFLAWHDAVSYKTRVANSSHTSARSINKEYLADLGARGVPVVPSIVVADAAAVSAVAAREKWETVVLKPAVGLGGRSVILLRDAPRTAAAPFSSPGEYVVQPYLASIETEGEYSVVCIDGEPSHTVRKRPAAGGFKVHEKFGGVHEPWPLTDELAEFGYELLDATGMRDELTARYDMIRDDDGRLRLLEMDLFGPCLYLCHRPEAADRLAAAIASRLR